MRSEEGEPVGGDAGAGVPETRFVSLFERIPEGYTVLRYGGRRYGVTRTAVADGRGWKLYAEELGGTDVVSANLYLTERGALLRPCEMPREKVEAFLADVATGAEQAGPGGTRRQP